MKKMFDDDVLDAVARVTLEVLERDDAPEVAPGKWAYRIDADGVRRLAMPPDGTTDAALVPFKNELARRLGSARVVGAAVDPQDPGKGERLALSVDGPFVAQSAPAGIAAEKRRAAAS